MSDEVGSEMRSEKDFPDDIVKNTNLETDQLKKEDAPAKNIKIDKPARRDIDRLIHVKGAGAEVILEKDARGRNVLFADNYVITSKYTLINFLPKNLFEQFSNLANLYFLGVGILQILPWVTTTQGIPTMYEPLAFIVAVSALRAASEDWNRHKADKARNSYPYDTWQGSRGWRPTKSGDLKVGDIVRVKQNDMIPSDMIFLGSALSKGHCFIDKANLNGETTLEVMTSIIPTRACVKDEKGLNAFHFELEYEPPNTKFDSFRGWLTVHSEPKASISLDGKALLMRETNLRNAEFIVGMVVYTGDDTKIQMSNSTGEKSKVKKSRIMRMVDTLLKYMLLCQIALCLFCGIAAGIWNTTHVDHGYLDLQDQSSALVGFLAFFSWFILLSQMLPISLIVSAEMVKFFQSIFIQWDVSLYHIPINKRAKCNSSTIHEDLGMIDYVFSDKTGTLTQNRMQFRYALIPAGEYGSKETEIAKSVKLKNAEVVARLAGDYEPKEPVPWTALIQPLLPPVDKERKRDCCERYFTSLWANTHRQGADDDENSGSKSANEFTEAERQQLLVALWGPPAAGETAEQDRTKKHQLRRYMTHMALSNTVKPYEHEGELRFQAESAEELAMVQFARTCGYLKKSQNPTVLEVKEYSPDLRSHRVTVEKYNHLATFGFSSKRARVTVIYQRLSDSKIEVMVKGQDSVVVPLLKNKIIEESLLLMQLKELGTNGLRTLLAGDAVLDTAWWEARANNYQDLITRDDSEFSEGHSAGKCAKAPKCEKCARDQFFEDTEKAAQLTYLGCIGMEDQLQLLVPETIRDCLRAGIKVWMITGDKLDTAKNIGLACNLIDPDMQPVFSASSSVEECVEAFNNSRLVEVTGQWASLVDDDEELGKLFDMFDIDQNARLDLNELDFCLKALKCSVEPATMKRLFDAINVDHNVQGINKAGFVSLMKSTKLSKYEAVLYDIEEGIKRYNSIEDHLTNPVSILVNRDAFLVMFPPKLEGAAAAAAAQRKDTKADVSEEQLESLRQKFFLLASVSKSVIFARAEPAMKKRMVTEIMARVPTAITLAVGDGANDTDMIKAAHIGVGIAGVEGTAAVNSADYAVGTFRMLHTLLFVHGFWAYNRVSDLVYYIFYKASLVAISAFFFCFFSGFSGQQFFNDPPYQLYNVVFTALPVIVVAVFDKKLPKNTLENNPSAFREQKGTAFTSAKFFRWIVRSFVHGLILYFMAYGAVGKPDSVTSNGMPGGIWAFSIVVFMNVVVTACFLIVFDMASITLLHFLSVALSFLSIIVLCYLLNLTRSFNPNLYNVLNALYGAPVFWLTVILSVSICMLMELAFRAAKREFRPSYAVILQEKLRLKRRDIHRNPNSPKGGAIPLDNGSTSPKGNSASSQVVASHHDEEKWAVVKHQQASKHAGRSEAALKQLERNRLSIKDRNEGKVREAVVRAMLRFRNLTGGQFDSAAQAKWQNHDPMVKAGSKSPRGGAQRGDESKVPEGPLDV